MAKASSSAVDEETDPDPEPEPEPEPEASAGRLPHLIDGQRVQVTSGQYEGRMASVSSVTYTDAVQEMISRSGGPESRYAQASSYVLRTRDGRAEIISVSADQVSPLEPEDGWGRGQV
jgi:hypothetical protein